MSSAGDSDSLPGSELLQITQLLVVREVTYAAGQVELQISMHGDDAAVSVDEVAAEWLEAKLQRWRLEQRWGRLVAEFTGRILQQGGPSEATDRLSDDILALGERVAALGRQIEEIELRNDARQG
jgi:dephospho-CoA kinase